MKEESITVLEELFAELIRNHNFESQGLNAQQLIQLQGQTEESLELLNDVVEELRLISPKTVATIKSITLKIFECDSESKGSLT